MANYYNDREHAFKAFSRDIKENKISDVLLFFGQEDFLINWAKDTVIAKYINPNVKEIDLTVLSEDELTVDNIVEACETFPFMSAKKVVVAKDFSGLNKSYVKGYGEKEKEKLLEYIKNPNENTILIFIRDEIDLKNPLCKLIESKGGLYDFHQLDNLSLKGFIAKRFKAQDVGITPEQIKNIIEFSGYNHKETEYNIWNLDNDIKKIIALCNGEKVKDEDIYMGVQGDLDTFVFNFIDGITTGKKDKAFSLLENILKTKGEPYSIIGLLVNQFELMLQIKEFREDSFSKGEIQKKLKINEFRLKKILQTVDFFSVKKLKELLVYLYEIDRNVKSGLIESSLALELFLIKV